MYAVVLAAGLGKRMKSALPKVLNPLLGRPMLAYVLDVLRPLALEETILIVGHGNDLVEKAFGPSYRYVKQDKQLGTAHALQQAAPILAKKRGTLLVLPGDIPLLQEAHLQRLLQVHLRSNALATVLTADVKDPTTLGRVCRTPDGAILKIVEEADASPDEMAIHEVSTSVYVFSIPAVFSYLERIKPHNAQSEYYLNDVLPFAYHDGVVEAVRVHDIPNIGVNDREQLSLCRKVLHERLLSHWMKEGVTVEDPGTVSLDWSVRIGSDTVIRPFTILEGSTCIGRHCQIGPFVHLRDSLIQDGTKLQGKLEIGEER
jgi:bifunctional UDP-N-acetylglucosamine pyrophosphorylase/glucosamine-1-phosphate N-acetyltransferase